MSRETCSGFCLDSLSLGVDSLFAQIVLAHIEKESPLDYFTFVLAATVCSPSSFLSMLEF